MSVRLHSSGKRRSQIQTHRTTKNAECARHGTERTLSVVAAASDRFGLCFGVSARRSFVGFGSMVQRALGFMPRPCALLARFALRVRESECWRGWRGRRALRGVWEEKEKKDGRSRSRFGSPRSERTSPPRRVT